MHGSSSFVSSLHRLWLISLVCAFTLATATHGAGADEVDDYIRLQQQKWHIPGVALAVIRDGRVVKEQAYGLADVEQGVPVSLDTVFEIGSITKQFTATAVMMLGEKGKIGLDEKASAYLEALPGAWKEVTIRQLLSHTSGIPDYEAIMGYGSYRNPMTSAQVFALVADKPKDFPSGTRWSYSNTGYYLLTLILEKVSGEPYGEFLQKHILQPLGMLQTRTSEPLDIIPRRSAGYAYEQERLQNRDPMQPTATGGAGTLVSTLGDLAKWDRELANPSLLSKESYAQMWTDVPLSDGAPSGYGLGWFVSPIKDHRSQEHSGGTAGFAADVRRLLDDHLTVIVLTNCYCAGGSVASMTGHIARLFIPALVYEPIADREPAVTAMVKEFFSHRTDPEVYDKPLSSELTAKMKPFWEGNRRFYQSLGPLQSLELVERRDAGPARQYRYRLRFKESTRLTLITLDGDGKISAARSEEE